MVKVSKKWIWLSVVVGASVAALIAWQPLYTAFIDWYLCAQCRDWLGGDLHREEIAQTDGKWMIHAPAIVNAINVAGADFEAKADKIELSYDFHPLSWELDLNIVVENPQVTIRESDIDWDALIIERQGITPLMKIIPKILIKNGKLDFIRGGKKTKPVHFDIDVDLTRTKKAEIKAGFSEEKDDIIVQVERGSHRIKVIADFDKLDMSQAFEGFLAMMSDLKAWEMPSGLLTGQWTVTFGRGMKPSYSCDISCSDFSLNQPGCDLKTHFNELSFAIEKKSKRWTLGLSDSATVALGRDGEDFWNVKGLTGQVDITPGEKARVDLKGLCHHDGKDLALNVEGGGLFANDNQEAVNVGFRLTDETGSGLSARLFARQLGEECDCYEAEIRNFGPDEYALLQYLAGQSGPEWYQFVMDKGFIDAEVIMFLEKGNITDVKVEKIQAKDLGCFAAPWNMAVDIGSLTGNVSLNLEEDNLLETIGGELAIHSGSLDVDGWKLNGVETTLKIHDGQIQKSAIKGSFAGMAGTIDLDSSSMGLNFTGPISGLAALGPDAFSKGINKQFSSDSVTITADVTRNGTDIDVKGKIAIEKDEALFGFGLQKKSKDAWAVCSKTRCEREESAIQVPLIDRELNIAGFWIKDGWFEAKQLPLEKYVAPFFLYDSELKLTGIGDFDGAFDQKSIAVKYDAQDLTLESDNFLINIPKVSHGSQEKLNCGIHNIDLEKATNYGFIPAHNATYLEKNSGLLFTDIRAQIYLDDTKVRLPEIEAFCSGLYFAGDILFDLSAEKKSHYDLTIQTHTISGRFSQLQNLFSHFDKPLFFLKMPFEGNLNYRQKGGTLTFNFYPGGYDFQASMEGAVTDGVFKVEQKNLLVEEVSLNFAYDYQGNTLDFTDLQGTLLLGKPQHVEEYNIAADHIRFTDYQNHIAEFDVWIGDKKRDVIRLVGTTEPLEKEGGEFVQFYFDRKLSHFGAVHPTSFNLVMRNWVNVDRFDLQLGFDLQTLFHDLQRLGRTGLIPLSRHFIHKLDDWKSAEGNIDFTLHYDKSQELMTYELLGENVAVEKYKFRDVQLKGGKSSGHWMVDQLKLDAWSFAADLTPKEDAIKVNFLGAQLGDSLLLGLEGHYDLNKKLFDGNINLLEVNLEKLDEWDFLQTFAQTYAPTGEFRASGKLSIEGSREQSGFLVDALLETSIKSWGLQGLRFDDIEGVSCHLTSDRGITFRRINTALKSDAMPQGLLCLERVDYNFLNQDLSLEGLSFNIPVDTLRSFIHEVQKSFPHAINDGFVDFVTHLKRTGNLEGALDLEITNPHYALKIALKDGVYQFLGQGHEVNNLTVEYDPCEFKLTTQYLFRNRLYWLQSTSRSPILDQGEMTLSTHHPGADRDPVAPLTMHWCYDDKNGYYIERMFGPLEGYDFDLVRDESRSLINDAIYLEGEVVVDANHLDPFFHRETVESFQSWEFGKGYALKGRWEIHLPSDENESELYFHGDLFGKNFVCRGYEFDSLTSKIDLSPKYITIRNLEVTDPAGVLYLDQLEIYVDEDGKWVMSLPQAQVNDFWPSMLREVGTNYAPIRKPLVVNRIELNQIKGDLRDAATFVGNGKLFFSNPPKKNLQNTIFAVPAEILSRIGLDLKVLNPVTGSIYYDIHDRKIFLTRFKDIFSEGKLSRFYLPNTDYKSYVDFDGNLHVQVKMKQYNLVFKLAELFTVTIQGTLTKPTYSLQKQQSRD